MLRKVIGKRHKQKYKRYQTSRYAISNQLQDLGRERERPVLEEKHPSPRSKLVDHTAEQWARQQRNRKRC